jgi:hypothetical protein
MCSKPKSLVNTDTMTCYATKSTVQLSHTTLYQSTIIKSNHICASYGINEASLRTQFYSCHCPNTKYIYIFLKGEFFTYLYIYIVVGFFATLFQSR